MKNDLHQDYYEAILQIRPARRDVLDFVFELTDRRNDVKVSKVDELKTGYDVYLTDQKFARGALATQLKRRFKGKIVITRKIYGVDKMTSRTLYRATVLFRLDSFQ